MSSMEASGVVTRTRKSESRLGDHQNDVHSYFYGLPWSKHIVIFDTLIEKSSPDEIEAVLGHELGHWYYSELSY